MGAPRSSELDMVRPLGHFSGVVPSFLSESGGFLCQCLVSWPSLRLFS